MASVSVSAFTERETKLMAAACQSFKGDPQLDMERFSALAGLTVGSARNAWTAVKKKFTSNTDAGSISPAKGRPKAAAPRGSATSTNGRGGKGARKRTSLKKRSATIMSGSDDEDEHDLVKPEGSGEPAKKKASKSAPVKVPKSLKKPKVKGVMEWDEDSTDGDDEQENRGPKTPGGTRVGRGGVKVKHEAMDDDGERSDNTGGGNEDDDGDGDGGFDEI